MALLRKDRAGLDKNSDSLSSLILGNWNAQDQHAQQKDLDVSKAREMLPIDVDKAKQMIPVEAQQAGATQAAKNDANLKTYTDFAPNVPDGASVHVGDLAAGVDPALKYAKEQRGLGDKAVKDATDAYNKGLPKIQDQFNAATEGLQFANDAKNIGSLGQARTLALKSLGMNRYNEQEAKAVVPPALQGTVAQLFNSAGGDESPLNDSQKRSLNMFFTHMAKTAKDRHEMLKQNTLGSYKLRNGYDPNKEEGLKSGVMHNFDQQYDDRMKGFNDLPTTASAPQHGVSDLWGLLGRQKPSAAQGGGLSPAEQAELAKLKAKHGR